MDRDQRPCTASAASGISRGSGTSSDNRRRGLDSVPARLRASPPARFFGAADTPLARATIEALLGFVVAGGVHDRGVLRMSSPVDDRVLHPTRVEPGDGGVRVDPRTSGKWPAASMITALCLLGFR